MLLIWLLVLDTATAGTTESVGKEIGLADVPGDDDAPVVGTAEHEARLSPDAEPERVGFDELSEADAPSVVEDVMEAVSSCCSGLPCCCCLSVMVLERLSGATTLEVLLADFFLRSPNSFFDLLPVRGEKEKPS